MLDCLTILLSSLGIIPMLQFMIPGIPLQLRREIFRVGELSTIRQGFGIITTGLDT
jgi:hypothetical protein